MLKNYILGSLCFLLALSACERDDICAASTPTTPLLAIAFFDETNRTLSKDINLRVQAVGSNKFIEITGDTIIRIPLRTDTTSTSFIFTKNPEIPDAEEDPNNADRVTFNYNLNEVYIDRACGFKVTYAALTSQYSAGNDSPWITDISINNSTIVNDSIYQVSIIH
ncbi:DUF6452 family protein [Flavimarina sp. Hel_I_48]|uniref:DUF6452 family protein n=1 Tax=Flavimarina sp. Hel_I_48 TaxID=1392488 RepID=UPI00068ADB97|nr:DUF6452 family protein [Flavimarina sp. Hel_I_48]